MNSRLRLVTRLALGLAALALVVFAVVGTVLVTTMHSYLAQRLDEQLASTQKDQIGRLLARRGPPRAPYAWYSAVFQVRDGTAEPEPGGSLPSTVDPLTAVARDAGGGDVFRTVYIHGEGNFRVRACPVRPGEVLVSAAPQGDLDRTVRRLVFELGAAFVLALAVLVFVGRLVLRKGLRPLSDMAATARNITGHDLTRSADLPVRVSGSGGGVEVEELRTAFNRMLEHIDASLAARTSADERLRRFVADASHELRTPLTSIRGYAELFRYAAANEPAERDAHLARIRAETARMSVLVDDLLLLARLDSPDMETPLRLSGTDLAELAGQAAEAFRVAQPAHPLTVDIAEEPLPLRADPVRLRQVIDNLLTNAAAHTPPGTQVTLTARRADGAVELAITDTGPGIPPEHQTRVFDRFYRVDDSRTRANGGSGLGLAVVHLLVTAHGGTVTLESRPGRTVFTVRLPSDRAGQAGEGGLAEPGLEQ
ncbi:HAMP domain-containing sensor histidine kinase [Actinophytocola sp.]|uniref:sensor histidine kinase n=1 Tax=Actinophytocola sp. TaxID=1872138 RepID=UPI002D7E2036|nr:HAMP domain-containing sensor histidine kinase [Actinophytocola sp.]HET9140068.1 HAMP domain-containing sensor histidine kinase [Actinophytocola sp.]